MRARWLPIGVSLALGAATAMATRVLDIPGNGSWVVACWVFGVAAAVVRPGWTSFAACVAGIVLGTILLVATTGQSAGLAWLVVAFEAAVLGHGFLVSAAVGRARRLRSLRDAGVAWGLLVAAGLGIAFVLIAKGFAGNPP